MIAPTAACRKRRFANQNGTDVADSRRSGPSTVWKYRRRFPAHGEVARPGCGPVSRGKLRSIKALARDKIRILAVTGSLARITMPPHFGQPPASLTWEKRILRWSGSFGFGFLSPQPPGIVGAGPNAGMPYWANGSWSFFFLFGAFLPTPNSPLILRSAPELVERSRGRRGVPRTKGASRRDDGPAHPGSAA